MFSLRTIHSIYTDGACTGNPGPGGWGLVIYFTDGSVYEQGGNAALTTNNRMEMQAAIAALTLLASAEQSEPVTLYTDSEYLLKGVTQWVKGWKKKGWKTAQGKDVLNRDLWETLDELNTQRVKWQHVRGHTGDVGNERCDAIARAFANGRPPNLQQLPSHDWNEISVEVARPLVGESESDATPKLIHETTQPNLLNSEIKMMDSPVTAHTTTSDELPREVRVAQLRNLIETLHIADEIAVKGYLITSSELADLMDVHASAVTSRGDEWRWRNWIVSRVRREGNQILWELERGDQVTSIPEKELEASE
ncbi:MAG: ribonuclease HI [Chroococcidiopsidaceae cyanobacterium CP_BM_ER_R8_30]|nr:ribonuclease HI [Chroococcidiopsidaceae cyanobacterium CP_BM_ER_R8_30]